MSVVDLKLYFLLEGCTSDISRNLKPGKYYTDFWSQFKVSQFSLKKLSDPGIFTDPEMHLRPFLLKKIARQAPAGEIVIFIDYSAKFVHERWEQLQTDH